MALQVGFLAEWAKGMGLSLSKKQLEQFQRYQLLLLEWNERMNLTAITVPAQIQLRHFLDSLSCATVTGDLNGKRLIDVGTGAGFPGLPLKILYPALQLSLVESVIKKTTFLTVVVKELDLQEVLVLPERAEVLGQSPAHREQYDWAVGRSVAELRVLAEYLLPFCHIGGAVLAQKGEGIEEEVATAMPALSLLGGGQPHIYSVQLPERPYSHYLVQIPKIAPTPTPYPRRAGIPAKNPIQRKGEK